MMAKKKVGTFLGFMIFFVNISCAKKIDITKLEIAPPLVDFYVKENKKSNRINKIPKKDEGQEK